MVLSTVSGIKITGISSVLPAIEEDNQESNQYLDAAAQSRIIDSTGIRKRRVAPPLQTSLDLAKILSHQFLEDMGWMPEEVGLLIFVTQSPDYPFPGNAVQMQAYLGLSKNVVAFDVNLGCSGFVYGLWQVAQLLLGLTCKKALLFVGDTTSRQYSKDNRAVNTLFGDAVSLIAVEKDHTADPMVFELGADGEGAPYLIQPNGGARNTLLPPELYMDGTQVFVFTLREIPKSIISCLEHKGWSVNDVDFCVLHQANEMMLKRLGNKIGFSENQMLICMGDTGNVSSASIPLAMCLGLTNQLSTKSNKLLLSGFGVGWSWGTVAYEQSALRVCKLLDLKQ